MFSYGETDGEPEGDVAVVPRRLVRVGSVERRDRDERGTSIRERKEREKRNASDLRDVCNNDQRLNVSEKRMGM